MNRQQAMRARRAAANRPAAQETPIPLPLSGLFVQAKRAQVSNLYAAELNNFRSTGVALTLRPGLIWGPASPAVLQRVPFEFGNAPGYIELTATGASFGAASFARPFGGKAMSAAISSNIVLADGLAAPVRFDGTTFTFCAFSTTTGVDPATFDGMIAHHDRLFFWKSGTLEFYSGDVGGVTGPLKLFPLNRLGNITGSIAGMQSLTMDAGHGMNDVLAIFTTTGQIIAFEGLDPSDPQDWRLLGRVSSAVPLDVNAFAQVGSDVWMLTPQGVVSVQDSLRQSIMALASDISLPILDAIGDLMKGGPAAWQIFVTQDGAQIIINCVRAGVAKQIVYYNQSRSWATASMPVKAFHNLGASPQATGFDGALAAFSTEDSGEVMTARWVSSWFQTGRKSSIAYLRPKIRAKGPLTVRVVILADSQDEAADIAESEQTVTLHGEEDGPEITLYDQIASDATGRTFQLTLEVTAAWAEIIEVAVAIE